MWVSEVKNKREAKRERGNFVHRRSFGSFDEARLVRQDSALRFSLETSRDDQSGDNDSGGARVQ